MANESIENIPEALHLKKLHANPVAKLAIVNANVKIKQLLVPKDQYSMLKIYNTLTRQKEVFKPIVEGQIGMYVCGITIYDYCHIGHGRTFVAFDTVVRYLRHCGYKVKFVRNITDVDDKIIKRAAENGESCDQLTARFTKAMHSDFAALHMIAPDIEPTVTGHMDDIIDIVKQVSKQRTRLCG